MRITGLALIVLGLLIATYVVVANLVVTVRPNELAGPIQGGPDGGPTYWFALIPAVGAILLGSWLVYFGGRGDRETYDMRRQQT